MTETNLIDYLSLPNHYLQKIYSQLEDLTKEAIDDGDLHTANRLLSLVITIQALKQDSIIKQEAEHQEGRTERQAKKAERPRYVGYDAETKEMRDAILTLVQKNLLNINVDISSRTLYSIIQRHHLSYLDSSKLDKLTLPMSESRQDRPIWKEAVTQALLMMINEGLLDKVSRYSYSWTEKARENLSNGTLLQPANTDEVEVGVEDEQVEMNISRDEYMQTVAPSDVKLPRPFAVFSKPKIYGQDSNGNNAELASRSI